MCVSVRVRRFVFVCLFARACEFVCLCVCVCVYEFVCVFVSGLCVCVFCVHIRMLTCVLCKCVIVWLRGCVRACLRVRVVCV